MSTMEWIIAILIIAFMINRFIPAKGVTNLTIQETKDKLGDKNAQFIDVRTPGEYKIEKRAEFENIPLNKLKKRLDELDKQRDVVVICQSGIRSQRAAKILRRNGFEKVFNVKGGIGAWRNAKA